MDETNLNEQIKSCEQELAIVEKRRIELLKKLQELKCNRTALDNSLNIKSSDDLISIKSIVTGASPAKEKIGLFRFLFRGREDVFPRRFESKKTGKSGYQPACRNEWIKGICNKPVQKCLNCGNREFIPLSDDIIRNHLLGYESPLNKNNNFVIGVYPLLLDSTCWFLVIDFDKKSWCKDATYFFKTCSKLNIPAHLERSRSGNGGHVWVFFSEPIQAILARSMASFILTETMDEYPDIGFDSYDRIFPNQDTIPKDGAGFGNLIALPFQASATKCGNTLFIDDHFEPRIDQWQYLSNIRKMSFAEVRSIVDSASQKGKILSVRMPISEDDEEPWTATPSRNKKKIPLTGKMPKKIEIVYGDQLYISKDKLPPSLHNRLIHTAAFQNPEFYKVQAMRLSTYGKPRIISCYENHTNHIGLPRGCLDDVKSLLKSIPLKYKIVEKRFSGAPIDVSFKGSLRSDQELAALELNKYENGVLSASTAFGKTVIGAYMIAQRSVNTIVLVHRKQLMEQWKGRLQMFLDIPKKAIGQIA